MALTCTQMFPSLLCTGLGTEAAGQLTAAMGLPLSCPQGAVRAITLLVKTDAGSFAGGTLDCYLHNETDDLWYRCLDLDRAMNAALQRQGFAFADIKAPVDRIIWLPNGISGNLTIDYHGVVQF